MSILDIIYAYGHRNVSCTHNTTIEVTKDKNLSERGNCILAIMASKGCFDLNSNLKEEIWKERKIKVLIQVADFQDSFYGFGNRNLQLSSLSDIVFRKSDYICERTILINCSKASNQINKKIIYCLKEPHTQVKLIFKSVCN